MDQPRFAALCAEALSAREGGIGTLGEKRLHAVLKRYYEPHEAFREVKVGRYVADIRNENGITEIQTGSFSALRKKLPALLQYEPVTLVHPLPAAKTIRWIDPETGLLSEPRRSPKKGAWIDACYQLCFAADLLSLPGLTVQLLLVDLDEYRLQNGWGNSGKRGSTRHERLPCALNAELTLRRAADYLALLPEALPDPFTTTDLRRAAKRSAALAAKAVRVLLAVGAIEKCGKHKNSILYTRSKGVSSMKLSEMTYTRPNLAEMLEGLKQLCARLEAADEKEAFAVLEAYEALSDRWTTEATLASIRHTCDTRDTFYDAENDFFDESSPLVADAANTLNRLLLKSAHRPALEAKFGKLLFQKLEISANSSCEAIIPLMQQENALTSRYEKLYASAQIPFDGKLLTVPQMAPYKESPDRAVRRAAMIAEGEWFDAHRAEFDEIYTEMVKNRTEQAKQMGYDNYIPLGYLRMSRIGYGQKEVAAYREAVANELVPVVAELKELQRTRIGTDKLCYYDDGFRFAEGNAAPHGTPEEILAAGKKMYHELSPETAEFIDFMFEGDLFDVLSREGKAPGGYCTYIPDYRAPFIFSNFNATADDVDVLTHEAGHAFAAYLAAGQKLPSALREPGLESCEIHSMSMEFLTSDFHHLFFAEDTARYQLAHAEAAISFLPYGCMVDEFQHLVYAAPDASAEERNAFWAGLEKKYRPWIDFESLPFYGRGAGWQRQLHIYELPFYYIDYCLAQTVALQFFAAFLKDKEDAWQRYLALTKLAGTRTYTELVKSAGFTTPFEPGAVKEVAVTVANWIKANQL